MTERENSPIGFQPKAIRNHLTHLMLKIMFLASVIAVVISIVAVPTGLVSDWGDVDLLILSSSAILASTLIMDRLVDRIGSELVAAVMVILIIFLIVYTDTPYQVSHGRTLLVFAVPIVMAAFLIRPWTSALIAILSSVIISVMSLFAGYALPNIPAIVTFHILALLVWKLSSHLEETIEQLASSQERLEEHKKQAILYLDVLGHDFANNLQAILLALEFIKAHSTSEEIRPVIDNAIATLHDSNSLIREAKKFESINQGELKPFEICKILAICVDVFKNEYPDIAIESEMNVSGAVVKADAYVADLFSILLDNAIQHNPKAKKKVWVQMKKECGGYVVSIADNGPGIPDLRKSTLFDLSRRYGGLGLHLAKLIVENYKGTIVVENRVHEEPGKGTKFRVWLPAMDSGKDRLHETAS